MHVNQLKLDQLLDRVVGDLSSTYGGVMISLGHKLGLYRAMAGAGPISSSEVAERSGCAERYVREWLNSQAAGGYVKYNPTTQTYELTPEQKMVLADEDSGVFFPPAWEVPISMWLDEEMAMRAFRTGIGIPWDQHNGRLFCGVAAFFRNAYRRELVQLWLPALDGVEEKLHNGALVADIGCGYGHSTIVMAEKYKNASFIGFDYHEESIVAATRLAEEKGLADRVSFKIADARNYPDKNFDLICMFDCLHDMGDPLGAMVHARKAILNDGTILLVEPYASDRVEENLNPVGRLYYAASTTICCAHALSEEGGYCLGAQAGEQRLADIAYKAGFTRFRKAAETPFNLILEARP